MKNGKLLALFLIFLALVSCSKKDALRADRGAPFDLEASFSKANAYLEKKEYEKARELFLEIKGRDNTGKYAPLAQLRMADSYSRDGEIDIAVDEYSKFLDMYPEHKYAPYAKYQMGMVYYSQITDPERGAGAASKALGEFLELQSMYPRNPYKDSLEMKIEKCRDVIATYEFLVGEFYFKKDSCQGAVGRFSGILEEFPGFRREPQVLYMASVCFKELGQKEKSEEYFGLLAEKYPESAYLKKAKKELKK